MSLDEHHHRRPWLLRFCCPHTYDANGKRIPWIKTDAAESIFGSLILINAIVLGFDVEASLQGEGESSFLFWLQLGFVIIFIGELALRIIADGAKFLYNAAGIFDAVIVLSSVSEYVLLALGSDSGGDSPLSAVSVMRIFRLLRIARIVRVLQIFPELTLLIHGLAASAQAVFWVFCLLIVFMYMGALICASELGHTKNEELNAFFGTVGASFYTHFMIVTLEGYPEVARVAGAVSPLWYVYIVCFILFSSMVLMNLVTGIVCESVVANAKDEEVASHVYEAESAKFREVLQEIVTSLGYSSEQDINFTEFRAIFRHPDVREALNTVDICLEIDEQDLFEIIDEDGSGSVSFYELFCGFLRLRGSKDMLHSLLVQCDLSRHGQVIRKEMHEVEGNIGSYATSLVERLEGKMKQRINELGETVAAAVASSNSMLDEDDAMAVWSLQQRFRIEDEEELKLLREQANVLEDVSSAREAVHRLNAGVVKCDEGCCIVYSASSHAHFLLYHKEALPIAHEMLKSCEDKRCQHFEAHMNKEPDSSNVQLESPECVCQMLETARAAGEQTRGVLEKLRQEFQASQQRVRALERKAASRHEATQTDPAPSLKMLKRTSSAEDPCWEELEDKDVATPVSGTQAEETEALDIKRNLLLSPLQDSDPGALASPQDLIVPKRRRSASALTDRRRKLEAKVAALNMTIPLTPRAPQAVEGRSESATPPASTVQDIPQSPRTNRRKLLERYRGHGKGLQKEWALTATSRGGLTDSESDSRRSGRETLQRTGF
eukprot:TRINITY_DN30221_c0_g1_i1.p1 TRINITY_DN30221_c0_g1~~TRINITY_DN30221_c0_g1_i1.p1  ORF type:complete len:778 (+),score=137.60 TRINITY_DN30221_c0_g1_i1:121-2454(+)